jgi:uncharacterized membrane protein YjfL (UPF0719 family)
MGWIYLLLTFGQLIVVVLSGAVATYLSVVLFDRATQNIDEWNELKKGNAAIGVVLGAIVVAVAWLLRPALAMPIGRWDVGAARAIVALGVQAVQLLIGLMLSVLAILFSLWLFDRLTTNLDEWAELKRGNVAVATLLAGVIIAVALLVGEVMASMFQLVTPYLF